MYLGSDAVALAPFTNQITYLEDGDWALSRATASNFRYEERPSAALSSIGRLGADGRQGQSPPFHDQGDLRAAGGHRPYAGQLCRLQRKPRQWRCRSPSISLVKTGSTSRPAARLSGRAVANTGLSGWRDCRLTSMWPPNSAIAKRRFPRMVCRYSSPSPAKPPTRWRA